MTYEEFENLVTGDKVYDAVIVGESGVIREHEVAEIFSEGSIRFKGEKNLGSYYNFEITRVKAVDVRIEVWRGVFESSRIHLKALEKIKKKEKRKRDD